MAEQLTRDPKGFNGEPFTGFPGTGLPDIKRYITTHNAQGEGVFLPSDNGSHQSLMGGNGAGAGGAVQNIMYTTQGSAIDMNEEADLKWARDNAVRPNHTFLTFSIHQI